MFKTALLFNILKHYNPFFLVHTVYVSFNAAFSLVKSLMQGSTVVFL